jgi:hypothetical protein
MQVMDSVDQWYKNTKIGKSCKFIIIMLSAIYSAILFVFLLVGIPNVFLWILSFVIYIFSVVVAIEYKFSQNAGFVPDDLLLHLASDSEIPVSAKQAIADKLKKDGRVAFIFLKELDFKLLRENEIQTERIERENGAGYQKMMKYLN